ncbi:FtsQ-type POTRA domain-containing protein [Actinomyces sp. 186855]|nr:MULTISPECIES: FtsQ-type POTRA domain-containing protein [unclassified Actinomyces]MCL3778246.1 FtsQ-type POTRA domain-containing protein [Actinomyces sp. AC-20-1]MCL3790472.1 FtsQ-type POTRA domain-containing protein [Actinomyces sp. 187325]MCL3792765.1 FtsQ-type POTRA domain-containing protein [Actinomyces sp. 186855]MCL3795222.1 FtsQ-type POTRA domain-containing protein [Actinomyces sp. 217892]
MAGALAGRRTDVPEGALSVFGRRSRELAQDAAGEGGVAARTGWDRVVSTGLEDRRRERERAERQLRLRRLGTVLAVLVAAAVLVWGIGFSPLLALRGEEVRVTGSDGTVEVSQVRQALAGHEGTSLVRLDPAGMGQEVAAALVRVRSARVTRSWPHGVEVALTMRVPVAARQTEAGYEVLDGEAVVLEVVEAAPAGTALITHEGDEPLGQDQVTAVALVVGCLDTATRGQVASASASGTGQVTLVLTSGATVFWGDTSQSVLKAEVLRSLLTRQASTYDVSSPHSPTTS